MPVYHSEQHPPHHCSNSERHAHPRAQIHRGHVVHCFHCFRFVLSVHFVHSN